MGCCVRIFSGAVIVSVSSISGYGIYMYCRKNKCETLENTRFVKKIFKGPSSILSKKSPNRRQ